MTPKTVASLAILALLGCRARGGARGDRSDVVAVDRATDRADAARATSSDGVSEASAAQGVRVHPRGHRCAWVGSAADVWRGEALSGDAALEVGAMLRLGCPFEAHAAPWVDVRMPSGLGFSVGEDEALVELSPLPGVAATLLRGRLRAEVPRGALAPLRVDTAAGRVVLTEGSVELVAARGLNGEVGPVTLRSLGATARRWRLVGDRAESEALPTRGERTWPAGAALGLDAAEAALNGARVSLNDDAPSEAAQNVASLQLGVAAAQFGTRRASPARAPAEARRTRELVMLRDLVAGRLVRLAR
ncbi:MAG: hypothetical protein R3A48_27030 [Polyangiales bacterium]